MIDQRLLKIKREFLLQKHKEAETIINQDSFTGEDIEKLMGFYNMCEEYSADFFQFVSQDLAGLKNNLKKILNDRAAVFNLKKKR